VLGLSLMSRNEVDALQIDKNKREEDINLNIETGEG
jgi:hypothetical protein